MYPDFKNYDEYNHYILSYASNQDVAELEKKIDDIQEGGDAGGSDIPLVDGKIPTEYLPSNIVTTGDDGTIPENALPTNVVKVGDDGLISSNLLPSYVDDVIEVESLPETGESGKIYITTADNKQYRWSGSQFVEITSGGVVIGDVTGTAYDGGKGTALETKVTDLEAIVLDKLDVDDVAVWAKSEDPTTIPLEKMDENIVKYSDFSYVPSGETEPVARKTIQLANYDSISGLNTEGNDAANLIMMSKWNKVDIGSSRYPVNLNGSEFTLNDEKIIATTDQIPDVSNLASKDEIPTDVVTHEELANYPSKEELDTAINGVEAKIPDTSNFATKEEIPSIEGFATEGYVDQKVTEIQVPDISDLTANVQTVGESVQIGQENKGINLKTSGDVYSGAMINSEGYIPTMTPYPGEDGRYVLQMRNHDSLSGVSTDGSVGGNLAMLSKYDVADFGSKNFHTNLNVKVDNGHNGRVTVNDDNEIAYLTDINEVFELNGLTELETSAPSESIQAALRVDFETLIDIISKEKAVIVDRNSAGDYKACIHATGNISSGNGGANLMFFIGTVPTIFEVQYVGGTYALYVAEYEFASKEDIPSLDGYATTQNLSDAVAAEAQARNKAIETATSDLVHNTTTVAGKSLTGNITLASTDLTDSDDIVKKESLADEVLGLVINETTNETIGQALPIKTQLPFARNTPLQNQTEQQIFNLFDKSGNTTSRTGLRDFIQSNPAYVIYIVDSSVAGHTYYKLPIMMVDIPDSGDIKVIAMGPDIYNNNLMTKFTYTIVLNGDASSVTIDKKALES